MALTDTKIKTAKSKEKPYKLYDQEGLYLLVNPSGSKLWRLKYPNHGKEKLLALGEYPFLRLADARERTFKARKMLSEGVDPMAAKKAAKNAANTQAEAVQREVANTFKAVSLKWHKWWAPGVDSDTANYIMRRLEADVFPDLGSMSMNSIKPSNVKTLILGIEERGARDVAQRQHGTISQIFRYAVVHELADVNPASAFKPSDILSPRRTKHRAHIAPANLPALLIAMDNYDANVLVRHALKLMTLTFVRTSELLEAEWSEFDLENARWVITAERMKMDKPHIVPLSTQAVAILRELKQLAGDKKYVFPGLNKQSENKTINCNSLLNALRDIGYKYVMTGHGFRGLARTILAENGFEKAHVELQLSHSNGDKVEAAYNSALYLTQRTALMQWWADYIDQQRAKTPLLIS
jgi:integrase